ncbi:hypothetical protein Halha_1925 [Halobacteroides halobius DSM 5150]|uniref:Uncharacterized protein n=1 Tax=Halobacteroides halobius (strain ATCC 35273 / DSM 5150 / MD-1) TaxID=748449 RepID=L0KA15_HALHC|nr:DUF6512 family protein [Halobacteroides halobius]AGB41836.1 hypothetical protein Halha_1925 [Halobacteroides halobius DSM 5150]
MHNKIKQILIWEIIGGFWIIIVGSLLHFLYDWSNNLLIIGIFSPVNESVWEHLKLGYWSLFFFSLVEYSFIKKNIHGYFWGEFLGILSLEGFILIIFYTYTALIKKHILWIDITSYLIGSIICQIVSFKIIKKQIPKRINILGLVLFITFGLILILFTFFPPHFSIFMDSNTGTYGIYGR